MTSRPPKAPRRSEYLKNGNFCRSVLLRLIAPKPDLQMATSSLDWPFLSCSDRWTRSRAIAPTESTHDLAADRCARRRHGGPSIRLFWKRRPCFEELDRSAALECHDVEAEFLEPFLDLACVRGVSKHARATA